MAWFKKKDRIIDLTEHYRKQEEKANEIKEDLKENSASPFGGSLSFFGGSSSSETTEMPIELGGDDRKKKLAKRLIEMTEKLEDLSNQIYHLQQRVEVLERKSGVGRY